MTLKTSLLSKAEMQAAIGLTGILDISNESLLQEKDTLRDELEKDTVVYLNKYANYIQGLTAQLAKDGIALEDLITKGNFGTVVSIREVVKAFARLQKNLGETNQQGHIDIGVLTKQLSVLYTRIEQTIDIEEEKLDKKRGSGKVYVPQTTGRTTNKDGTTRVTVTNKERSIKVAKKIAENIRQLRIASKAVDELPKGVIEELMKKDATPLETIQTAVDRYITKGQQHHDIGVTKTVNVTTGQAVQRIELESKNLNKFKGDASYLLGTARGEALSNKHRNSVLDQLKNVDFTKIKGSPSLEGEIVSQITDIARGRKHKKFKTSTKKGKTLKSNRKTKLASAVALAIAANRVAKKGFPKLTASPKKVRGESGRGDTGSREVNKLRVKINQRLPAEVRRNMGRPALINQTGRFSNSVTLTELRQGPKTLVGKYAYMISPYETFENEGARQWPTGYNPKPLITKSIRKLAMQYTEQKFTLRRE